MISINHHLVTFTKKNLLLAAFVLLSFMQFANAQETITLKRATELVLQNNLQIKQAQLSEALSDETLKQSKLALYPSLNASSSLRYSFGRNPDPSTYQYVNTALTATEGSLYSNVALFQGFQKLNQISQNKYALEADKSNTQKVKNDLLLSVVNGYLVVLNSKDLLVAAKQQLDISLQQLDREQKFFDVGNKTLADLSQAKSQQATAELNVTNAQNQLDIAFLNLAQLLELDPAIGFDVEKPVIDNLKAVNSNYSAAEVSKKALDNFPEIKLAQFRTLSAKKAIDISKGYYYPTLNLQSGIGSRYSTGTFNSNSFSTQINNNFYQYIGFGLDIPLFNGFSARSSVRKAKINYQNAEINEQLAKNNLNKTINQAVLDLLAAEKRYNSALYAFQSSKDAFNVIEQRYNVGLVNSLDYNQAQTNLNKAQFDQIQAKYDLIFRSKVIDYYLGNPISF